jgi:hypothetical protein
MTNRSLMIGRIFLIAISAGMAASFAFGQATITLPQLVTEEKHMELVSPTQNAASARITNPVSSNTGVAQVYVYRSNQVQVVAVGQGQTLVSFFDSVNRVNYRLTVWVQAANSTGGGGNGYDKSRTPIPQIVMSLNHTQNVMSPANAPHNINSIQSSNPSVATARTDTAGAIQIYSRALGDTWIDFSDNGVRYQVHVYVRNDAGAGNGGNGGNSGRGNGGPNPGPNPNPKPNPNPNPNRRPKPVVLAGGTKLDPCLVGTWISGTSTEMDGASGMSGIELVINPDRKVSINYTRMQPSKLVDQMGRAVKISSWSGEAAGHISSSAGQLMITSLDSSSVTYTLTSNGRSRTNNVGSFAPLLVGAPWTNSYTCGGDSLVIATSVAGLNPNRFNFSREK